MKNIKTLFLQWLITLIPVFYYLSLWKLLPEEVPTHYDFNLNPDDFHSKGFMLGILIFMGIVVVGSNWLMLNKNNAIVASNQVNHPPQMINLSWIITLFISGIMLLIVMMTKNYCDNKPILNFEKFLLLLITFLFMILGYFMKSVKQNYFFGIRTPWTLENEENWRKTHLLSSKVWVWGSLLISLVLLFCPENYTKSVFFIGVFFLVMIPVYYSYQQSKKLTN
jgi:uncharacterized membrane protein